MNIGNNVLRNVLGSRKAYVIRPFRAGGKGQSKKKEYEGFLETPHRWDVPISAGIKHGTFEDNKKDLKESVKHDRGEITGWSKANYGKGNKKVEVYDSGEEIYAYGQDKQAVKDSLRQRYINTLKGAGVWGEYKKQAEKQLRQTGLGVRRR